MQLFLAFSALRVNIFLYTVPILYAILLSPTTNNAHMNIKPTGYSLNFTKYYIAIVD